MNVFFTIDYELFLGGNTGTVRNCLIRPLNALTELLDKYQIKLTLFMIQ